MWLSGGNLVGNLLIDIWMLVLEAEVFQFCLDGEQTETVGEGSVDIQGLACNLVPFVRCHGSKGPHVVQTVGHFD